MVTGGLKEVQAAHSPPQDFVQDLTRSHTKGVDALRAQFCGKQGALQDLSETCFPEMLVLLNSQKMPNHNILGKSE